MPAMRYDRQDGICSGGVKHQLRDGIIWCSGGDLADGRPTERRQVSVERKFYFYTDQMTVGYGGRPLIKNIRMEVEKGEILTLIGAV